MNKYKKHSKANLSKNLIDPLDAYDEAHKESLQARADKVARVFAVARQLFEILSESKLKAEDRTTALALLNTLHNRLGGK